MCFGVKDALSMVDEVAQPQQVTIYGELVHNPVVRQRLLESGFQQASEQDRETHMPETPLVLITAHGVSNRERSRLLSRGANLIDTTCPLVRRAHRAAVALDRQGYFVVVLGKPGHVEVAGLTGDLQRYAVVESIDDVEAYPADRLGIVCQTTLPPRTADELRRAISRRNAHAREIRFVDTVCRPTKDRQQALERLLDQVDCVVVVGGRNSNNTRALAERCRERGVAAWQVEGAEDLDPAWFGGAEIVGLTAGTSTLDETIDAVQARLEAIADEQTSLRAASALARFAPSARSV
jgi:4-hydroxy-3-methylbut-2-enyl diphosphate reductase